MQQLTFLISFIPIICVYFISMFFPVTETAGKEISFRPPGYVFGITWTILLLLLGVTWVLNIKQSYLFIILTILLSIWSIIFKYSKLISFIDILLSLFITIFIILYNFNKSKLLLIPLSLWLSFAGVLNYLLI